ncbi:BrnT family toxin [Duganella sacchari]|uniref:BrnT family toxin n=1 Tax=Duganella sacchari TaxID=551987 RepID=UPI0009329D62|nr:BrnT family toxin [Duganella sacchari]
MCFEWDPRKARLNLRTHGVSFEEASTVFDDPRGGLRFDLSHSDLEDRFLQLGRSSQDRLLLVSHCYRNGKVRIISAPKVLPIEEIEYFRGD